MSSETPKKPAYTSVIDLTTRGQQAAKQKKAAVAFAEPDPALPEAKLDALPEKVRAAVASAGWKTLMPVQEKAIPYILAGRDLIVQSRTGSGKTGAFLLPLFERLNAAERVTQILILTPTRELARQIHEEFMRLRGKQALDAALIYGGVRYGPQIQALEGGAQIVVGTPGRILDHLERRTFHLDNLDALILDEADEMLSMGFYPAMRQLKRYLPEPRRSYMYSATMPAKVRALAREFLHDPGFLSLSIGHVGVDAIEHRYYKVDPMDKDRALVRLIEMENPDSAIIFANTKREVEYLGQFLKNYGYDADVISGDLSQNMREQVMDRIRKASLRFLVATDVAARGIDISDLSHVFMYDIPQDPEYYVHRSGRTARAGKTGTALVLTTLEDERNLLAILHRYDIEAEKREVPTPADVAVRVAERMTVVLEDRLREKSKSERKEMQRLLPLVKELTQDAPQLFTLLIDDLYHELLHGSEESSASKNTPDREPVPADEEGSRIKEALEGRMQKKSNLERERMQRFEPLVEELAQEEPDLFALLIADHYDELLYPAPEASPQKKKSSGGNRRNQGRGRRNKRRG